MDKLNIFLRFPETDDEVLDFVDNPSVCEELSKSICMLKAYLKKYNHNYCLLYDSGNVEKFKNKVQVLDSGVYLSKISRVIQTCIGKCSRNIDREPIHNPAMIYAVWDCCSCAASVCVDNVIKSASEQSVSSRENTIVWFLTKENGYDRDIIPVVIDAPHRNPILSVTQLCETSEDCIHWIRTIEGRVSFSLRNLALFEKTHKIYQPSKQRIYKKRDDDTYWYYDFFHHTNSEHYEVFDKCGTHIGEADMSGAIDDKKKDSRKTISGLI